MGGGTGTLTLVGGKEQAIKEKNRKKVRNGLESIVIVNKWDRSGCKRIR
jgi:hypothetical protein